jgi:hypothetical protein
VPEDPLDRTYLPLVAGRLGLILDAFADDDLGESGRLRRALAKAFPADAELARVESFLQGELDGQYGAGSGSTLLEEPFLAM